jgi:hypothetical protein
MFLILAVIMTFLTVFVPLLATAWLWKGKYKSRVDWLLRVLVSTAVVVLFILAGSWSYLSIWLKWGVKALFIFTVIKTFPRLEDRTIFGKRDSKGKTSYNGRIAVLVILLALDFLAVKGRFFKGETKDLNFPLRDGRFLIVQGGASPITNFFHNSDPSQKYALDIVKLNAAGNRANGFFPDELSRYKSFGEVVYSPCAGTIAGVSDGLPDNKPRGADRKNPAGNHIVIDCGEARVLLAHLMQGSIVVKAGQFVKGNQLMAQVGNSGDTAEPHLHIQAWKIEKADAAIALTFDGELLVMNSTFKN